MLRLMGLDAIALLRLSRSDIRDTACDRELSDGVLVRIGVSFALEPDALQLALRRVAGDALDRHRDPRGVLVMPEVAAPRSASYEEVVLEVGDGGTWVPIDDGEAEESGEDFLGAVLHGMASAGMQDIVTRARDMVSGEGELDPAVLGASMPDLGALMREPAFMNLVETLGAQLSADPTKLKELEELMASVVGARGQGDEEDL